MDKTLQEHILSVLEVNNQNPDEGRYGEGTIIFFPKDDENSGIDSAVEGLVKVAQIYALEQQIELLKSLDAARKDEIYGDIDLALFRMEEQLKQLKKDKEKGL